MSQAECQDDSVESASATCAFCGATADPESGPILSALFTIPYVRPSGDTAWVCMSCTRSNETVRVELIAETHRTKDAIRMARGCVFDGAYTGFCRKPAV